MLPPRCESKHFLRQGHYFALIAILAAGYFVAGKFGLTLAFVHPSATAVWPCSGIALAAFLILGPRVWPGILLGAFFVNMATAGSIATSVVIAIGNTLEGLAGAFLVNRLAGGRDAMDRTQDVFKFAILAGMLSTTISATIGVTTLCLGGFASWANYSAIWVTWWLGDTAGDVIVAPLLLSRPGQKRRGRQISEALALFASLLLVGWVVFNGVPISGTKNNPLEYLCMPFLVWTALRFGQREAAVAMLMLCGTAIWGTLHGGGPFARESPNESLLLLQAFLSVVAVTTTVLAAEFAERRRVEQEVRAQSSTDALTALGNYRKLVDTLEAEIQRSDRTKKSFGLLLMDLDGLKKINDVYGHLIGNRALCRLASVLRLHCRRIDTAARYGGDEFALLLPETEIEGARLIADRITDRLLNDGEQPALSVSVGVTVWPQGGATIEGLLRSADRALYETKNRVGRTLAG